jgi:hypothetical protein
MRHDDRGSSQTTKDFQRIDSKMSSSYTLEEELENVCELSGVESANLDISGRIVIICVKMLQRIARRKQSGN